MRIALVAPLVSPIAQPHLGGAQALLADLARGLHERGHAVTLFAREGSRLENITLESVPVPPDVRPTDFANTRATNAVDTGFFAQANLFLDRFLELQQRADEFDLIHAHAFDWPAFACSLLARSLPVLHTLHLPAIITEINDVLRVLDHHGHPLTLATVSHSCAETYAPYTSIDHIVHNGLDVNAIPFQATVPVDAPLLCAGRIAPEKGVAEAIEIAEQAGMPLVIAGGIYDQEYYEQRILPRLRRARTRIDYIGLVTREELWRLMGQAAALLCPIAWDEPFGLVAIEAMATGTPVIAFKRGAMPEIIEHGKTGFLVEPGACSQAVALLDDLPDIPRALCRTRVEEHFTLSRMIDAYERIYQTMLA